MGEVSLPQPVLLLIAAFSRHPEAIAWARQRAIDSWGPIALESSAFPFAETDYYQAAMGGGLSKQFLAFERLIDPGRLPKIKLLSNHWEADYTSLGRHPEPRPLNLDPGYLDLSKLVLASTKDYVHRIYLADGIYAEITLHYQRRAWRAHEWTFPDYRRPDYHEFFCRCRRYLHARRRHKALRPGEGHAL